MNILEQIQQIIAKPSVALGTSGAASAVTFLEQVADVIGVVGQICTGTLAILLLLNWLYMKLKKD